MSVCESVCEFCNYWDADASKNYEDLKNEDNFRNQNNLKNEDYNKDVRMGKVTLQKVSSYSRGIFIFALFL